MKLKQYSTELAEIVIGCIIYAIAVDFFIAPVDVIPGSTTGIGIILKSLFGIPVGGISIIINVPLILIGAKFLGKKLIAYSATTIILSSALIDLWATCTPFTTDPLMCSTFGGLILGVAMAFILHAGATTGGTSVVGRLIVRKYSNLQIGSVLLAIDMVIMLIGAILLKERELVLYSSINQYVCVVALDKILYGIGQKNVSVVCTGQAEKLVKQLNSETDYRYRLVSYNPDLLVLVTAKNDVSKLLHIAEAVDPSVSCVSLDVNYSFGDMLKGKI